MSDEHKNYILVQGASGSELSFTYNAENITVVQLLYQLDEAKKKKDVNVWSPMPTVCACSNREGETNEPFD